MAAAAFALAVVVIVVGASLARAIDVGRDFDVTGAVVDAVISALPEASFRGSPGTPEPETGRTPARPGPTPTSTPEPQRSIDPETVSGSPYSLPEVLNAWGAAGLQVTALREAPDIDGVGAPPVEVRLQGGNAALTLITLVYPDAGAVDEDWSTQAGGRPSPRGGMTIPAHESAWWNANVVVIVVSRQGSVGGEPLEAFLELGS